MDVFHYPCAHPDSHVQLFGEKGKFVFFFFPQLLFNFLDQVFPVPGGSVFPLYLKAGSDSF